MPASRTSTSRRVGHVAAAKGATTTFEPLIYVEPAGWRRFRWSAFAMLFDPSQLRDGFKPTGQKYTFAARVSGKVKTAFPEGRPPADAAAPASGVLKESTKPLNLIVVADSDVLQDFLWVRMQNFFGQRVASAIAKQRRSHRERPRQSRRQLGSDQCARPRHVHAAVRSRGRPAPEGRRSLPLDGAAARGRTEEHGREAHADEVPAATISRR